MNRRLTGLGLLPALAACAAPPAAGPPPVATFSIAAWDPEAKEYGVAVASRFLAVGAVVPWVAADAGAVATQAWANTSFGPKGLALLRAGKPAADALAELLAADSDSARRQVGIVDARGGVAAHTGSGCMAWAGHRTGEGFTCQGNILTGPQVVEAMAAAFGKARGDLADRLIAALAAGDRAGGDSRGRQSAALYVARAEGGYSGFNDRLVDLRVDDHPDPVGELGRLNRLHRAARGISGVRRKGDF